MSNSWRTVMENQAEKINAENSDVSLVIEANAVKNKKTAFVLASIGIGLLFVGLTPFLNFDFLQASLVEEEDFTLVAEDLELNNSISEEDFDFVEDTGDLDIEEVIDIHFAALEKDTKETEMPEIETEAINQFRINTHTGLTDETVYQAPVVNDKTVYKANVPQNIKSGAELYVLFLLATFLASLLSMRRKVVSKLFAK